MTKMTFFDVKCYFKCHYVYLCFCLFIFLVFCLFSCLVYLSIYIFFLSLYILMHSLSVYFNSIVCLPVQSPSLPVYLCLVYLFIQFQCVSIFISAPLPRSLLRIFDLFLHLTPCFLYSIRIFRSYQSTHRYSYISIYLSHQGIDREVWGGVKFYPIHIFYSFSNWWWQNHNLL